MVEAWFPRSCSLVGQIAVEKWKWAMQDLLEEIWASGHHFHFLFKLSADCLTLLHCVFLKENGQCKTFWRELISWLFSTVYFQMRIGSARSSGGDFEHYSTTYRTIFKLPADCLTFLHGAVSNENGQCKIFQRRFWALGRGFYSLPPTFSLLSRARWYQYSMYKLELDDPPHIHSSMKI